MQEYANHFARWILHSDEYLQDETSVYILKACRQISQSFEESLREGKHVKNLEIPSMNNKTIIEFGCRTM